MGDAKRRKAIDPNFGKGLDLRHFEDLSSEEQAEMATRAFKACYGEDLSPIDPYTADDGAINLDSVINAHLRNIDNALDIHPLKRKSMMQRYASIGLAV